MTKVFKRNPHNLFHPMSFSEFFALSPAFDWETYLKKISVTFNEEENKINVTNPDFYKKVRVTLPISLDLFFYLLFSSFSLPLFSFSFIYDLQFNEFLSSLSLDDIKTYLSWKLVDSLASYLGDAFDTQNFEFFGKVRVSLLLSVFLWMHQKMIVFGIVTIF